MDRFASKNNFVQYLKKSKKKNQSPRFEVSHQNKIFSKIGCTHKIFRNLWTYN